MKNKINKYIHIFATRVSIPWRLRMLLAATYVGTREGLSGFIQRINGKKPITAKFGSKSYFYWLRAHNKNIQKAIGKKTNDYKFLVFVESPSGKLTPRVNRTLKSLHLNVYATWESIVVSPNENISTHISKSNADFLILARSGVKFSKYALAKIALTYFQNPTAGVISFDSDISIFGKRGKPLLRPKHSPEMLMSANYLGRDFAIRRNVAESFELRKNNDLAVWEVLLKATLSGLNVVHSPNVLATEPNQKSRFVLPPSAEEMVSTVVSKHLNLNIEVVDLGNYLRIIPQLIVWPTVSIIVPTRHSTDNLNRLFGSLEKTDYDEFNVRVIDNGINNAIEESWYQQLKTSFNVSHIRWEESPFNYSQVNNVAARSTDGEIIVFLNDDTEIVDSLWLKEMVGLLHLPDIGSVGYQHRNQDGLIQHGGVILGPGGFADNLFAGLHPHTWTLLGSTDWYRDSLAVTGACVAITRENFELVGGFDERFELCGSDVALGLDLHVRGLRNIVSPVDAVRHFESLTRGTSVPMGDFFASYWRYLPWLQNGDPYISPNVSQFYAIPKLADLRDPKPVLLSMKMVGRSFREIKQSGSISKEAKDLLELATINNQEKQYIENLSSPSNFQLSGATINWFLPDIDTPFFGGFNTAFRIASQLVETHSVTNRFVFLADENYEFYKSAVVAAFPNLENSDITFYNGERDTLNAIPHADVSIATLWLTAFHTVIAKSSKKYFYLIQDFEPGFYPASTMYALAQESYKLSLNGICNTPTLGQIYENDYSGKAISFIPAVDRNIYFPPATSKPHDAPVRIFVYARDHFRNCSELALASLGKIKKIYGDRVEIVVAGARYLKPKLGFLDLGLMDYRESANLFRTIDIGLTLQISRHPSYLPLELMACGVPMVAPKSEDFKWLFEDGTNSLLTEMTIDGVVDKLRKLIDDEQLRRILSAGALSTIDKHHSSWSKAISPVIDYIETS